MNTLTIVVHVVLVRFADKTCKAKSHFETSGEACV